MKPQLKYVLPLLAVSVAAIVIYSCNRKKNTEHPTRTNLTEAVYASGNVYPRNEYKVFANADGIVSNVVVTEGDSVRKGSLLLQVQNDMQQARLEAAQSALEKTTENFSANSAPLNEAKELLKSAQLKMRNDSLNYFRLKNLFEKNAIAKVEFERAQLAYEVSQNDYNARQLSVEKLKNQLWLDMKNAQSNARVSAADAVNYNVTSYLDGIVYQVLKKEGEGIRRGEPLALLGSGNDVLIQLSIDESDLAKVKLGQEVLIKTDAYRDKIFKAHISRIYPMLNKADQSVRVDAEFAGDKPVMVYGLTVEANIIVSEKKNALTIPRQFLQPGDTVWVKNGRDEDAVRVKTGAQNFDRVEILEGLNENSELVVK